jgi:hypothetical protein
LAPDKKGTGEILYEMIFQAKSIPWGDFSWKISFGTNIVSLPYNYNIIVSGCSTTKGNGGVTNKKM